MRRVLPLFLLAACSPAPTMQTDQAVIMDLATAYPPPPYGRMIGDVFPFLQWEGYVNPTGVGLADAQPYVPYSSDDARRMGKIGMFHVSDFY
jgi:hypothetical protein